MNCREAQHLICAERDGAPDTAERAAFQAHLGTCRACRQMRDSLTHALTAWQADAQSVRVPDARLEWQKLRRQLDAPARDSRSLIRWLALPVTAAAAAVIAFGLYLSPARGPATPPTVAMAAPSSASVATSTAGTGATSTVVYVDDKSGWTFVLSPETPLGSQQHI